MGASKELFMEVRQDNICNWCKKPILENERFRVDYFGYKFHNRHGSDCDNEEYWSRNKGSNHKQERDIGTGKRCVN